MKDKGKILQMIENLDKESKRVERSEENHEITYGQYLDMDDEIFAKKSALLWVLGERSFTLYGTAFK